MAYSLSSQDQSANRPQRRGPSALTRGYHADGHCCLVPHNVANLFPLAVSCCQDVRTQPTTFPDQSEKERWAKVLDACRMTNETLMLQELRRHFQELFGVQVLSNYSLNGQDKADLVFKHDDEVLGVIEVKTDSSLTPDSWPEAQAAEYAAQANVQDKWIPAVCLFRSEPTIRIGIVVPAKRQFQGRTHFYVDLVPSQHLLRAQDFGWHLMKLVFDWAKDKSRRTVTNGLEISVERVSDGLCDWGERVSKRLTVLGVHGRLLECEDHDGQKVYAIKIVKEGEDDRQTVWLAQQLDPHRNLEWAQGQSTSGKSKVVISKWVAHVNYVRLDGVKDMLRKLTEFWRSGLVHGDLRPLGWGSNVVFDKDDRALFLDFEWAGRDQEAGAEDSPEFQQMRQAKFPQGVNLGTFERYLGKPDIPKPGTLIGFLHDINCVLGWLNVHILKNKKHTKKLLQHLTAAVIDREKTGQEQASNSFFAMLDNVAATRAVLFGKEWSLPPPTPPHFGDERIYRYEIRPAKRKRTSGSEAAPKVKAKRAKIKATAKVSAKVKAKGKAKATNTARAKAKAKGKAKAKAKAKPKA